MQAQRREKPCSNCPFKHRMTFQEVEDPREPGDEVEMLCHESGCLDGDGPDLVCRGYEDNLERLNLV